MNTDELKRRPGPVFTERPAWAEAGGGWRQMHGSFKDLGYSIEWHDFTSKSDLDWSRSFHPGGLEICLNFAGRGEVRAGNETLPFVESSAGFYFQKKYGLEAIRRGGERHQFVTLELSLPFLRAHFQPSDPGLRASLSSILTNPMARANVVSQPIRLSAGQQQGLMSLAQPPVPPEARSLWYEGKTLQIAAEILYGPSAKEELFCERVKRLNQDRVGKVMSILKDNYAAPPSLLEIGRRVGCSHFYLSRIFSQVTGKTIPSHLRELRMERAAALLREGKLNVTEVALEVGYSSPSHFTVAFRETFHCCPGLYPGNVLSRPESDGTGPE